MAFNTNHRILAFIFILILLTASIPNQPARALDTEKVHLPMLELFISQVINGEPEQLRGVYVPDVFAARVVQQPTGVDGFVSSGSKVVTQFAQASMLGATGLLAHNYLAGRNFSLLEEGREVYLIYGDGETTVFTVTETMQYQALEPNSTLSEFISLEDGSFHTASEVFSEVYNRPGQVIFQTCIAEGGEPSWGRLFVIAEPASSLQDAPTHSARNLKLLHRHRRK